MQGPLPAGLAQAAAIAFSAAFIWLLQATASDYAVTLLAVLFLNAALAVSLTLTNGAAIF